MALVVGIMARHGTADLEAAARAMVPDPAAATFARVESVPLPAAGESGSVSVTLPGGRQVAQPRPLLDARAAVLVLLGAALGAGAGRTLDGRRP